MTLQFQFRTENSALRAASLFRLMQQDEREWTETRQFDLLCNMMRNSTLLDVPANPPGRQSVDTAAVDCPAQDSPAEFTPRNGPFDIHILCDTAQEKADMMAHIRSLP